VYEGKCEDGKLHGRGAMKFGGGDVYEGEFQKGKMHGRGTHEFTNGYAYEGEWTNGERHGRGTITYPNGNRDNQVYKHDKLVSGKRFNASIIDGPPLQRPRVSQATTPHQYVAPSAVRQSTYDATTMHSPSSEAEDGKMEEGSPQPTENPNAPERQTDDECEDMAFYKDLCEKLTT